MKHRTMRSLRRARVTVGTMIWTDLGFLFFVSLTFAQEVIVTSAIEKPKTARRLEELSSIAAYWNLDFAALPTAM